MPSEAKKESEKEEREKTTTRRVDSVHFCRRTLPCLCMPQIVNRMRSSCCLCCCCGCKRLEESPSASCCRSLTVSPRGFDQHANSFLSLQTKKLLSLVQRRSNATTTIMLEWLKQSVPYTKSTHTLICIHPLTKSFGKLSTNLAGNGLGLSKRIFCS